MSEAKEYLRVPTAHPIMPLRFASGLAPKPSVGAVVGSGMPRPLASPTSRLVVLVRETTKPDIAGVDADTEAEVGRTGATVTEFGASVEVNVVRGVLACVAGREVGDASSSASASAVELGVSLSSVLVGDLTAGATVDAGASGVAVVERAVEGGAEGLDAEEVAGGMV